MADKTFKGIEWDDENKDEEEKELLGDDEVDADADVDIEIPVVFAQEYPKRKKRESKADAKDIIKPKANMLDEVKGEKEANPIPLVDDWLTKMMNEFANYNRPKGRGINPKHLKIMRKRALR